MIPVVKDLEGNVIAYVEVTDENLTDTKTPWVELTLYLDKDQIACIRFLEEEVDVNFYDEEGQHTMVTFKDHNDLNNFNLALQGALQYGNHYIKNK